MRRRFDEIASRSRDDSDRDDDDGEHGEDSGSEEQRARYLQSTLSEVSDPSYWQSLHHFDEEPQEMEVDQSHLAMDDDVPDAGATMDDATVDDRIHTARRSNDLLIESNNLGVFMGRVAATEPYPSGVPLESMTIDQLYAQHAPHVPLPGRNEFAEQFWTDYAPDDGRPRYHFREVQGHGEEAVAERTFTFESQTGLHGFRTRRIHLRYRHEARPGPRPDYSVTEANLYRVYSRMYCIADRLRHRSRLDIWCSPGAPFGPRIERAAFLNCSTLWCYFLTFVLGNRNPTKGKAQSFTMLNSQ